MGLSTFARRVGVYDLVEPIYSRRLARNWLSQGQPVPAPSAVKREILRSYAAAYGLRVLVETGTYRGDTVRALRHDFKLIHSIEIEPHLFAAARRRTRRQANALLHLGDSATLLQDIAASLSEPALFWLDAHFSGPQTGGEAGHPIAAEISAAILRDSGNIVLVDDVREFGVTAHYPTLESIHQFAKAHDYAMSVGVDIARLVPNSLGETHDDQLILGLSRHGDDRP